MPHYEFFCHTCQKIFSKVLTLVDYEEGEVLCPDCGSKEVGQRWSAFSVITSVGSLQIDGSMYEHDVVIDRGKIHKRKKKPSRKLREEFGHTPLSAKEEVPWHCRQLVIGTGAYGRLPVMDAVRREADRRKVKLLIVPTLQAIEVLAQNPKDTNAILHVTC